MLKKNVNGVDVICSPQEEAAIRAEWAENAAKPRPLPDVSAKEVLAALLKKGVITQEDVDAR